MSGNAPQHVAVVAILLYLALTWLRRFDLIRAKSEGGVIWRAGDGGWSARAYARPRSRLVLRRAALNSVE